MAYSIYRQETTGLWVVRDDSTGKDFARGDPQENAINRAIEKGMPASEKPVLLEQANGIIQQEQADAAAQQAAYEQSEKQAPAQTEQQNTQYQGSGGADDDSGKRDAVNQNTGTPAAVPATTPSPVQYNDYNVSSGDVSVAAPPSPVTNSGTTVAGKSGTGAASSESKPKPNKRVNNPLGSFSSYTYQISLYMVTPDAYNAFVESGKRNINAIANVAPSDNRALSDYNASPSGVYLVAQSGGINNSNSLRAPGFELDYYIDNLEIKSAISGKSELSAGGSTNISEIKFQIIEPYGFSFISKLKIASDYINQYSQLPNMSKMPFANRQFFILGVRFLGYDENGNVVSGLERLSRTTQISPTANSATGSFETFYDIVISDMKFRLDGRTTVYNITAATVPTQTGMGLQHGRLPADTTITASDVNGALQDLVTQLNTKQQDFKKAKGCEIPNQYEIVYIGDDSELIKSSSIVNSASDSDKSKYPALDSFPTNKEITTRDALEATPNGNKRNVTFKGSTSILQAIQLLVGQSDYIQNAIKGLYKSDTSPDPATDDYQTVETDSKRILKWINVSTEIINLGYDTILNSFAYKIRYIIQSYDTPIVTALTAGLTTPYYGPHKRYEYWFTGKNSEVIRFEMSYDNLYMNVAVKGITDAEGKPTALPIPTAVSTRVNSPRQGKLGVGAESQNAYINYLTDPGAYSSANMTILGDPDFLISDNATSLNRLYDRFYGSNGYTVNANGGQVFIEVDFKEAIDYDNNKGTMSVNDRILFFDYPDPIKRLVKGVSFQVKDVTSNFRNGKFEQTLGLITSVWSTTPTKTDAQRQEPGGERTSTNQGGNTAGKANPKQTTNTGLTPEPAPMENTAGGAAVGVRLNVGRRRPAPGSPQNTTPTGGGQQNTPVADDDAAGSGKLPNIDSRSWWRRLF